MGQPKAWLPFGDEFLLQRVVRIVSEVCTSVLVVSALDQALPPLPREVKIVCDERPNCGPLAGLERGLKEVSTEVVFLTSCDLPLLTAEFVQIVCNSLTEQFEIAVPMVAGRKHPLSSAYRRTLLPAVTAAMDSGERRMMAFLERHQTMNIQVPDEDCLRNTNTPAEYAEVLGVAENRGLISASRFPTVSVV
jgi:molybdopterin-guanine dinucleotide biosynthesis protein A